MLSENSRRVKIVSNNAGPYSDKAFETAVNRQLAALENNYTILAMHYQTQIVTKKDTFNLGPVYKTVMIEYTAK